MMKDKYAERFDFLVKQHGLAKTWSDSSSFHPTPIIKIIGPDWNQWFTSALGLMRLVFGEDSPHFSNLKRFYDRSGAYLKDEFDSALGVFAAAKSDYEGGYYLSLNHTIAGEVFGDFVGLAKKALEEDQKDVAAVLACAALEDTLKRYSALNDLEVEDASMQQVVAALKSKGLVKGPQKSLLDTMPKIRDYAMHANWDKISREDVGSVIGFVESFLLSRFS